MLVVDVRKQLRDFVLAASAEIPNGVTVILGPSGAGKTTLLRLIAGLLRPDTGRIVLGSNVLTDVKHFLPAYRRRIGMVFQEYALFPHLTVAQNVEFGLRAQSMPQHERSAKVVKMLEGLEIAALANDPVGQISGGQRQRVALARALVIEPQALLLDEPLSALDPATRTRVREELAAMLSTLAIPTLLVTHDEADRAAFAAPSMRIERGVLGPAERM